MSDSVLTVLKFCLLALLYLFLLRVILVVAREMRGTPAPRPAAPVPAASPAAPTTTTAAARPQKPRREWRLVITEPEAERGRSFAIDGDTTIGRGGGCTVPLSFDTFASTVHARMNTRDGAVWIEDVGSTNGTLVNGKRIEQPTKLRKGDHIQIGETVLEVAR